MDFKYEGDDRSFHILNAVSPGFTCALPFAAHLADQTSGRQPDEPERWGWEPYPGTGETTYHPKGKCIGWLSASGDIYLHPDVAYEVARDHAGRASEPLATTKIVVHKRLKEGDHLAAIDEQTERPTVVRRIAGKSRRVLHVRAIPLDDGTRPIGGVAFLRDVSEARRLQKAIDRVRLRK